MTTAQHLLKRAHFGPDTINKLCAVVEDTWAAVEPRAQGSREARRLVVAQAVMDLATLGQRDPERLKAYALLRLRNYFDVRRRHR